MEEIDIKELIQLIWKKKFLILLFIIIGAISGYIINTKLMTPKYKSSTKIILSVGEKSTVNQPSSESIKIEDIKLSENLMDTYNEIIKSDSLLNEIKENLNLDISTETFRKQVILDQQSDSVVFKITVENENPYLATQIANEIPNVFFEKIKDLYNITNAKVLDEAKVPSAPANVSPIKYTGIGGVIGFVLCLILIFIKNMFNDNITKESEVEEKLKIPVLAQIGQVSDKEKFVIYNKDSACSESFRILVSNIKYLKSNIILVTSNTPSEGKSWTSANLAVTYARSGKKILLIDADTRKGTQHKIFNINPYKEGLLDLVDQNPENINIERYITHCEAVPNLDIITKGSASIDYTRLLYTTTIESIINIAKEKYDFIIVDGTPASIVADDVAHIKAVDSTLIVVRYDKTTISDIKKMKNRMERNGGKVLGVVLNGVPRISKKYEYNYYGYSSSKEMVVKKPKAPTGTEGSRH